MSEWIPGVDMPADEWSRERALQDQEDWALSPSCFNSICERLDFVPSLDLFASRLNNKCERYLSFRQDPNAVGMDVQGAGVCQPPHQPHHQGAEEAETGQGHSPTACARLAGRSLGTSVQEHGEIRDTDAAPLRGGRASGQGDQPSAAVKGLAGCHSLTNPLI